MKQPLFPAALLFAGGILAGAVAPVSPWMLLGVCLGLAAVTLAWGRARAVLLGLLVFLAGWTNLGFHTVVLSPNDLRRILGDQPAIVSVRGTLRETPALRARGRWERESWRATTQVEVTALSTNHQPWQPAAGRIVVSTPGTLDRFFAGQTVEIAGVAALPKGATAEGTFDYRAYLRELGIYYQLQAASEQDWRLLATPPAPPLADRFRIWARRALGRGLPVEDESLRLEWALTLGWKTALTEEVSEPFIQAATYHIFAVDGLRMAIVFGIFFGLFRAVGLPRPVSGAVLIPLIWFYVALTGWPASAIRATVMLSVVIVGWVLKRPSDLLNSLFAAALIILAWEPQQIFLAGFQLSFLVVLCIILLLPPLRAWAERVAGPDPLLPAELLPRWRRIFRAPARYAGGLLLTSFAAWVGSLPLVAYYFHIVTPVSTPANVVAVPLCGLVLASNLASLLVTGWFPAAAECFNHAGWFLMECIRLSSHWFAGWPGAYYYVAAPGVLGSALYYGLLLAAATGWLFLPKSPLSTPTPHPNLNLNLNPTPTPNPTPASPQRHRGTEAAGPAATAAPTPNPNPNPAPLLPAPAQLFRPRVRPWAAAALGLAAALWCWQTWQSAGLTRLTVLPVSGGQAIYFDAPGWRNDLLIDCGSVNSVQFLTKPFLRAQGVNRLPGLVLTHGKAQQIGGAQTVEALFPARAVWASPVRFRSPGYRRAVQEFNRTPGKLRIISRGDRLGPWTILHPAAGDRWPQADDNALVLLGELPGARVLLLSALGRPGQNALLERKHDLRADIVITGLPAATEAIGGELLEAVQPRVIIVADSEFPASARASPRLRERLAQRGIPVLYMRSEGAVTLELNHGRWELRTMSGLRLNSTARRPAH
ncbi:MAG TPA: ComEC/Rec2 family competence protein [Dongiaceae bacterium]|nr:ComEC/Rec2 family competence protein [Dongiaceae bacterium]